jgi:prefoldin beta subunit
LANWDQEFSTLKADNTIFKLVGPALVEQDPTEAKANVEKRLEYIKSEM